MLFDTLFEAILDHAKTKPDKPAIILKETTLNYSKLAELITVTASILKNKYGVSVGDKVMITSLSKPEYLVAFLGLQYLHAITVPLDKVWLEETVLKLYNFTKPKIIISDTKFRNLKVISLKELYREAKEATEAAERVETTAICEDGEEYKLPDSEHVAEMLFTTGTTGTPKGAMLTYANIKAITENNIEGVGITSEDVILDALPLCHSLGIREARVALYLGATLVLQNGFSFPRELKYNIENFHCTGFVCVPTTMEQLTRSVTNFSGLFGHFRYIEVGAGSLSYDLKKRLPQLLPATEIYNTWGSSETGGVIFLDVQHRQDKVTALGYPVSSAKIKVINEAGQEIKAVDIDTAGRLAVHGPMNMAGYYNMPEVNAKTLMDGWLVTNDLVYTDDEGFVYMLGRADDIINVGGEKVSPLEIENTATEFDKVRDAACIGVSDPIMGQVPVLFAVIDEPYDKNDFMCFLKSKLESFKLPKDIIRVNEIPRNRMKKLDRKAVHKLWETRGTTMNNEFINLILSRHSVRNFTDQKIDKSILELLVKAAIQAPTGHNLQTWNFTVITNEEIINRVKEIGSSIAKREKTPFYGFNNPAAIIIVTYDKRNDTGVMDASCATENILLAAHALGLGACWLNGLTRICKQVEIRYLLSKFGIPENYNVCSMIALGYPSSVEKQPVRKMNVVQWFE